MNMGLLVEAKWVDQWYDTESTGGSGRDGGLRPHQEPLLYGPQLDKSK